MTLSASHFSHEGQLQAVLIAIVPDHENRVYRDDDLSNGVGEQRAFRDLERPGETWSVATLFLNYAVLQQTRTALC